MVNLQELFLSLGKMVVSVSSVVYHTVITGVLATPLFFYGGVNEESAIAAG